MDESAAPPPAAVRKDPVIGRTIAGKFLIESFLGGGAMGSVYRAKQIALEKDVAIKVMHGEHAGDATFAARFHREAKAASRLDHPNSMRVIDFGQEPDGLLYIAMEYLDGRDLFRVIQQEWPLQPPRIADILSQALAALAVAHEMGIVHRDLKPENIMLLRGTDDEGRPRDIVKVCDFGIAKFTDRREGTPTGGQKLTTQGIVVGTPEYMSPEQGKGEALDARSDIYAMGVILYQLLTGRLPFDADTALGVVLKHVTEEPVAPSAVHPPADRRLEAICLRAMRKKREDRYQSAREMRSELRAVGGQTDPLAHAATQRLAAAQAPTAPAFDSSQVAAAATPAITASKLTPPGTASVSTQALPRSRARLLAGMGLAVIALGGAGFLLRDRLGPGPAAPLAVAQRPVLPPDPTTLKPLTEPTPSLETTPIPDSTPSSPKGPTPIVTPAPGPPRATAAFVPSAPATTKPAVASGPAPAPPAPLPPPVAATPEPPPQANTPQLPAPPPASAAPAPPPAPAPAAFDPSHAHVQWTVSGAGGGATTSGVQRAFTRKAPQWTQCYRNALERRNERIEGTGILHVVTDEAGNVVGARINGFDQMPGVKNCIANASHVKIDGVDTGDAWADVQLVFVPE